MRKKYKKASERIKEIADKDFRQNADPGSTGDFPTDGYWIVAIMKYLDEQINNETKQ